MRKLRTSKVYNISSAILYWEIGLLYLYQEYFLTMVPGISVNYGKNIKSSWLVE